MKDKIWMVLVRVVRIMPRKLRTQLCRLLFAAGEKGDVTLASENLLILSEELRWYLNKAAVRYEGGIHPKHRLTRYHEYFTSLLKEGERVLDVGCGYGALADSMNRAGARVIGVDINERSINQARERYRNSNLTFLLGDICDISLPDDVQTIVMSNVLEHIENRIDLLCRLNEKISPSRFLIRVPMINRDWTVLFRKELGLPYFNDPTHFVEYTLQSFDQEMDQAGLTVISCKVMWGELYAEVVAQ